jgi:hypothetical protein
MAKLLDEYSEQLTDSFIVVTGRQDRDLNFKFLLDFLGENEASRLI